MDVKKRQIVRTNEKFLRDNVNSYEVTPHLISCGIISLDDDERIRQEITESDKTRKLLRIIEMHPNGYLTFIKALRMENKEYIIEKLESTAVDEEEISRGMRISFDGIK
ncbi:Hypothetical predicted protein [Mytilus galloprovincialis]|uniref:CARD domain-containing protein n=1 Tax=Mytilus galloprovincialis TaxID=29158 RepID=A0A8B6C381_MYTGA|nr:Hypothetical predicted protein [Mytilus galloprovincialis]